MPKQFREPLLAESNEGETEGERLSWLKKTQEKSITIISSSYNLWVCPKWFLTVFPSYRIKSIPSPPSHQDKPSDLTALRQIILESTLRRLNRKSLWKLVARYRKWEMK